MNRVVHCKREKFDVYIGRPSKWGNPFVLGKDGDREAVIQKYENWIKQQPELLAALSELTGKVLGCWCAPKSCHGDVLVALAESSLSSPPPTICVYRNDKLGIECDLPIGHSSDHHIKGTGWQHVEHCMWWHRYPCNQNCDPTVRQSSSLSEPGAESVHSGKQNTADKSELLPTQLPKEK